MKTLSNSAERENIEPFTTGLLQHDKPAAAKAYSTGDVERAKCESLLLHFRAEEHESYLLTGWV